MRIHLRVLLMGSILAGALGAGAIAPVVRHGIARASEAAMDAAPTAKVTVYRCPNGDFESAKMGACPHDKSALVKTSLSRTWKCGTCGMTYAHGGKCEMDGTKLTAYDVSYLCPADKKPVEHGGKCPRCAADAREQMTKAPASGKAAKVKATAKS